MMVLIPIFAILLILLVGMFLISMLIGLATSLMPEKEKERNLKEKDYNYNKKQTLKTPPQKKEKNYSFLKKQWLEELAEDENEEGV